MQKNNAFSKPGAPDLGHLKNTVKASEIISAGDSESPALIEAENSITPQLPAPAAIVESASIDSFIEDLKPSKEEFETYSLRIPKELVKFYVDLLQRTNTAHGTTMTRSTMYLKVLTDHAVKLGYKKPQ